MKALIIKVFTVVALLLIVSANVISQNKLPQSQAITVYVFLSETCPICQSYTLTLKELYKKYKDQNIKFIGVFPNHYSNPKSIAEFKTKYAVPFELTADKKGTLTKQLNATITPEVFVINSSNKILYSGRIDDSFYSLGKRRNIITATELADALSEIVSKRSIKISKTQAVGCIINSSK